MKIVRTISAYLRVALTRAAAGAAAEPVGRTKMFPRCGSAPGSRADRHGVPGLKTLRELAFATPERGPAGV